MGLDLGEYDYQEKDENAEERPLLWRLDPQESWSDWTIIISAKATSVIGSSGRDDENKFTFHVHKVHLSVGQRKSEYFARLFQNSGVTEAENCTSSIDLESSAADAFPAFLDFIYSHPGTHVEATATNAVALRYLSQYFGVRELFSNINSFIQRDLDANTAHIYLLESSIYNDEKMLSHATKICAENFQAIGGKLASSLPAKLFRDVVCAPDLKCESKALSLCVAHLCETQPDEIDGTLLAALTRYRKMPDIDQSCALFLLRLSIEKKVEHNPIDGDRLNLRERCISAATIGWKDILATTSSQIPEQILPADVKVDLLAAALREAKKEIVEEKIKAHTNNKKTRKIIEDKDSSLMDAMTNIFKARNDIGRKDHTLYMVRSKLYQIESLISDRDDSVPSDLFSLVHDTKTIIDEHFIGDAEDEESSSSSSEELS